MSFYLSLLLTFLLPTQLGKHFWTINSFVQGLPVDYLATTIYLTDLILLLIFLTQIKNIVRYIRNCKHKILLTLVFVFVFANYIFSKDREVTLMYIVRFIFLINWIVVIKSFSKKQIAYLLSTLSFSLIYVSLLAFLQFIKQASIGGLWYWFGERKLDVNNLQTAAIRIGSRLVFRPYSTFSHPNSLAGFTALTLILMNYLSDRKLLESKLLYWLTWLSGIITILLTTSRNVYIFGLPLVILATFPKLQKRLSQKSAWILISALIFVSSFVLMIVHIDLGQSINRRIMLQSQAVQLIQQNPVIGVGLGSFTKAVGELSNLVPLGSWQQPVHNIFWLVTSETGIIGLLFILYLIYFFAHKSQNRGLLAIIPLWLIVLTGSWDHYWLTLPQNRLLIAFYLGIVLKLV